MSHHKFVLFLLFVLLGCSFVLITESHVDAQNEQISAFTSPIKPTLASTPIPSLFARSHRSAWECLADAPASRGQAPTPPSTSFT